MLSARSFLVSRQNLRHSSTTTAPVPSSSHPYPAWRKDDRQAGSTSSSSIKTAVMPSVKRKGQEPRSSPSPSPPKTTLSLARPTTPTSPVQIPPAPKSRETAHPSKQHRHHGDRRRKADARPKDVHSPDAIPASVAALLAVTSIPSPRNLRSTRQRRAHPEKGMTVEPVTEQSPEAEKEFSLNLGRSPLDLLLSAPEDSDIDDVSLADSNVGSPFSRTASVSSMPSLDDSYTTNTLSSLDTPLTPFTPKPRKSQPTRKSLEPVSSPSGDEKTHPLSSPLVELEELDFRVFDESPTKNSEADAQSLYRPLKSAFKSNLTASLRALRQAARSFSALNFSSIPPEDFLTRSILTIDPQVPYTDERRPQLEEEPSAALRRYLNPTTNSRLGQQPSPTPTPAPRPGFTASIQMQTYKVQRQQSASSSAGRISRTTGGAPGASSGSVLSGSDNVTASLKMSQPGPRQREMRENSDFIRIAVMEMAMRKRGKLDDQRPGRARWALPPRKTSSKPYEIGEDGVPARWVAVTD